MKNKIALYIMIFIGFAGTPLLGGTAFGERGGQSALVAAEISAFANLLAHRPDAAIDLSGVSGEYCFKVDIGKGGHMTHYAIDPAVTEEDVIDFVNAAPLIEAGLDVEKLPRHSGKLGTMTPNQWYFLPKGTFEPHHGIRFPFPVILKAVNVK